MKSKKKNSKKFVEDRTKVCFSELGVSAKKAFYFHDQPWMTPLLLAMHALCLADAKRRADNLGPVKTAMDVKISKKCLFLIWIRMSVQKNTNENNKSYQPPKTL